MSLPACPACGLEHTYTDGDQYICPDCFHEWPLTAAAENDGEGDAVVRDANGTPLADGDSVILIKDLKVKGSSTTLKKGVKARNIRLREGDHEVDCKIDNVSYMLKACFLKKAQSIGWGQGKGGSDTPSTGLDFSQADVNRAVSRALKKFAAH